MYDNYPPGAANDPRAPYNQHDPELEFHIDERDCEDDEMYVGLTWFADGKEFCFNDEVSAQEYYDMPSSVYVPLKCKDMTDEELIDYIETNCKIY
jgi:hypothetical protein